MFRFRLSHFLIAILLFITEVVIAIYVKDAIIRPYGGDFLVVIMLYYGISSIVNITPWKLALGVLCFSYLIELSQYLNLVNRLGLEKNVILRTILGYGFDWIDIVAYTSGIALILLIDRKNQTTSRARI